MINCCIFCISRTRKCKCNQVLCARDGGGARGAPGLGELHVLNRIKPWAPRLVVSFRQLLQVSVLRPHFLTEAKNFDFPKSVETNTKLSMSDL